MKCPKCNGNKGQWDIGNYHWYPCDSCHETGEVEDKTIGRISIVPNKELPSGADCYTTYQNPATTTGRESMEAPMWFGNCDGGPR